MNILPLSTQRYATKISRRNSSTQNLLSRNLPSVSLRFGQESPTNLYQAMQQRWIPDEEFDTLLERHETQHGPYLGNIPQAFLTHFPTREAVCNVLDDIALQLSRHWEGNRRVEAKSPDEVSKRVAPIKISFIDSGSDGEVFKVQVGDQAFALKVFKNNNSPVTEFQALTFLSGQGAKDIMKSYLSGFANKKGWILSEFIPSEPPFTRKQLDARGPSSIAEVAQKHNILIGYAYDRVNSILVDAGFIRYFDPNFDTENQFKGGILVCESVLKRAYESAAP